MYGAEWIGLGTGAYSSYNGYVFANTNDIEEYIKLCNLGYSCTKYRDKYNTIKNIIWEYTFSLRIRNVSKQYYYEKYGKEIYETLFLPIIKYLIDKGYVCEKNCDFQCPSAPIQTIKADKVLIKVLDLCKKNISIKMIIDELLYDFENYDEAKSNVLNIIKDLFNKEVLYFKR